MPTYQYACTDCGHNFEAVQAFSDDALTQCPECEGRLRKIYNAVGVVFKGSGFYRTDSRSSGGKADSGAGSSGSAGDSPASTSAASSTSGSSSGSGAAASSGASSGSSSGSSTSSATTS